MTTYIEAARLKRERAVAGGDVTLLAIETSCDETAAAVVRNGRETLSNVVFSQIPLHEAYGGVVPEIASRSHVEKIGPVVEQALTQSGVNELSGVAVTYGPGLVGALLVGISFAKAFAFARKLPLVAVNHIAGHIAANDLAEPPEKPYVCLVASGGHSHLALIGEGGARVIARTLDDAAGEALDKFARALGLPYPGGPNLERLAGEGNDTVKLPKASGKGIGNDLSFSGLKTAALTILKKQEAAGEVNRADLACSFQKAVVDALCGAALSGAKECGVRNIALAGGVAANKLLRAQLSAMAKSEGMRFYCPELRYCTDNAAMIGAAGYERFIAGDLADLSLNAKAVLPL